MVDSFGSSDGSVAIPVLWLGNAVILTENNDILWKESSNKEFLIQNANIVKSVYSGLLQDRQEMLD